MNEIISKEINIIFDFIQLNKQRRLFIGSW